ncbi:universal stress protein [Pseudogemmobacter humi]|uniref:Universal stress protein UspE n=1 Tax=Pseudogemmobacter humi TaxID=2483812 RepID=A0A3P5Y0P6_9RHOB|nr:universal stress protein [Pseudogemmobacter humi]VDC34025.1 universal stress protein UspE [Pseudogemmobacter humi]
MKLDPARPLPFEEILERVSALKPDITIIDWPKADGILARRKRNHAISLLSKRIDCPLAVVHEKSGSEFGAVLAALDPDPTDEIALHLSREVLRFSAALAATLGLPLDLVNVWRLPEEHILRSPRVNEHQEVVNRMVELERQRSLSRLNDFIDAHLPPGGYRNLIHRKGGTTHQLCDVTLSKQDSILVLGSRGREGLAGFILGDRAERVIDSANSAVVVVKSPTGPGTVNEQRAA